VNWFPVELHCHTKHSDGDFSPAELIEQAKIFGLKGIALTDHNTVAGWEETCSCAEKAGICVLPGVEWTTYFGHMLVLQQKDCGGWMDLQPDRIDAATADLRARGGTIGAAHPFEPGNPVGTGCHWDFSVRHWENFHYYEVMNGENPMEKVRNRKSLLAWTSLLDHGYRLTPTSGIDWHSQLNKEFSYACTYVGVPEKDCTAQGMNHAILSGRTSLTMGPLLTMEVCRESQCGGIGDVCPNGRYTFLLHLDPRRAEHWRHLDLQPREVRLVTNGGRVLFQSPCGECKLESSVMLDVQTSWCRAELWGVVRDRESLIAMTAPIYFSQT
jgi:hypothetical protein